MENFFNYITKPLTPEDVDIWFRANNIIPEKNKYATVFNSKLNILAKIHQAPIKKNSKIMAINTK